MMNRTAVALAFTLAAVSPATSPAWAKPAIPMAKPAGGVDAVIADYEALARQTDGTDGPGWPDVSKAAADRRAQGYAALKARLDGLPPSAPDGEEALTRRLLDWRLGVLVEGARFDEDRIPFDNGDGFFNTANYAAATTVIRTEADAQAWIARLRALPSYYDQQIANMRRGLETGFVQPRPTATSVLNILKIAADQPAEASPLLGPLKALPATIPADRQVALRADALAAVTQAVKPAQAKLVAFFEQDYVPHARDTLGASSLPGGREYYAYAVRRSTTTDLTPDAVFALGEREVARIRGEMEAAMRATGFTGTLPEFIAKLRTDKQFYAPDLATYVEKASEIGKRIDGLLPLWFGKLPRLTWTIRQKPPEQEGSSSGYDLGDPVKGVPGRVVVGSKSFGDPLFGLPSWILHEGVPGHHLQIALGQERTDLPAFRRKDEPTAFIEGWALYSEQLGEDMGVYRTDYERFGRLSFDMWRACRLMMDVGIHWKGWSAEQAASCLRDNTALPERVVLGETQRYIAWPAQALAYKVGELKFLGERRRAEQALGARFDIRAFHDAVLDDGPMPMDILHDQMGRWLARQGAKP
ncbi:DUF885 domain-containing protein [Nitrospirillum viridazoti]|uniref:Uncharacterized protein (DUF885 family) n=1 Tax=Nitrospirillum amazonense TaxID=28077 RepID=A0A560I8D4_9PROT|nr:DUF885 family protein [Nitrospirillum amazonense]TWB54249.1 uncharacterized protein (DUF885 family) [Nitrospirillum amazonense]